MTPRTIVAAVALLAALLMMLVEAQLALFNERLRREQGAAEPPEDVYPTLRWAYPLAFVAIAAEGMIAGTPPGQATLLGAALFGAAKAVKFWVIATLRTRWTFRVLVIPGEALVTDGPYRWLRHPNYLAVMGEIVGVAVMVGAPVTGLAGLGLLGTLLRRRIVVEDRALGLASR